MLDLQALLAGRDELEEGCKGGEYPNLLLFSSPAQPRPTGLGIFLAFLGCCGGGDDDGGSGGNGDGNGGNGGGGSCALFRRGRSNPLAPALPADGAIGAVAAFATTAASSAFATSAMQIYQLRLILGFAGIALLLRGRTLLSLLLLIACTLLVFYSPSHKISCSTIFLTASARSSRSSWRCHSPFASPVPARTKTLSWQGPLHTSLAGLPLRVRSLSQSSVPPS